MTTIFIKLQHSTPSSFAIDCRIRLYRSIMHAFASNSQTYHSYRPDTQYPTELPRMTSPRRRHRILDLAGTYYYILARIDRWLADIWRDLSQLAKFGG